MKLNKHEAELWSQFERSGRPGVPVGGKQATPGNTTPGSTKTPKTPTYGDLTFDKPITQSPTPGNAGTPDLTNLLATMGGAASGKVTRDYYDPDTIGGNTGGNRSGGVGGNANQPYIDQLNSLYDQIMGRGPFRYDLNGDLLYRQMADQYTQLGYQAMRDATGAAAGLTGGYGNSYANQVGNQAYQQYLTQLSATIPEYYDRAYNAWLNEGDQLMQQYEMAMTHPQAVAALKPSYGGVRIPVDDEGDQQNAYTQGYQFTGGSGLDQKAFKEYFGANFDPLSGYYAALDEETKKKNQKK